MNDVNHAIAAQNFDPRSGTNCDAAHDLTGLNIVEHASTLFVKMKPQFICYPEVPRQFDNPVQMFMDDVYFLAAHHL